MIDSHCHIDLPVFDHDRKKVLLQAAQKGVTRILVPGLGLKQVKQLLLLKSQYPMLDIAAGFHPYFLSEVPLSQWRTDLESMTDWVDANINKLVAIGEFGIDGMLALSMSFQHRVFIDQLCLAQRMVKPVILHHRQSHNDIIRLLKQQKFSQGGVIHAFSGSLQTAKTYIDLGFKLGIGGTITYPRAKKTRKAIKEIALSDLLLETDSPDMPLWGYQGMRNSPEQLGLIAAQLAELKGVSVDEVVQSTTASYKSLFSSILAP